MPRSNFTRFSLCLCGYSLATHLAAPFFAVYVLQELRFGYATYTAIILSGSVVGFMSSRFWGDVGDRHGIRAVLRWTVIGASLLPLLWLVSGSPICSAS